MEQIKCDMCGATANKMGKLSIKVGEGILDGVLPKYQADICENCITKIRKLFKKGVKE